MTVRIVRLGSQRHPDEGLRIGVVRRPPRGVPKERYADENWYDVWYPNLAPSVATLKLGQAATTQQQWKVFVAKYRAEMSSSENRRTLELLAQLSHGADFSLGCYCEDEAHCHRSVLRELLAERGARPG
jgi:uncharacterized protein YeaO (DUF488 family)